MKIGILTFHKAYSYGAALQTYALCKRINSFQNCNADIIDYGSIGKGDRFHKLNFKNPKIFLYNLIVNILSIGSEDIRRRKFKKFLIDFQTTSKISYKKDTIGNASNQYDYIITGSDQVWHPGITKGDLSYLLDFVNNNNKKISYAPSFGLNNLPEPLHASYANYIKQINCLSVRETQGNEIIKKLTGRNAEIVLDPTFLLSKEEWATISFLPPALKGKKYILLFNILGDTITTNTVCEQLKKHTGLDIIRIGFISDKLNSNYKVFSTVGPNEFVGLIKNASYIITNSFHGTAFSIIFEKQFFTLLNENDRNSRMIEVAEKFGLTEQLIYPSKVDPIKLPEIDYSKINLRKKIEIDKSLKFLMTSLGVK